MFEQPNGPSVARVTRFRRKMEARRSLRQAQSDRDEEFDRILKTERDILGIFGEADIMPGEGLYGHDVPLPPATHSEARPTNTSSLTTAL